MDPAANGTSAGDIANSIASRINQYATGDGKMLQAQVVQTNTISLNIRGSLYLIVLANLSQGFEDMLSDYIVANVVSSFNGNTNVFISGTAFERVLESVGCKFFNLTRNTTQ